MEQYQTLTPLFGLLPFPPSVIPFPQHHIPCAPSNQSINIDTSLNPSPVSVTNITTSTYTALSSDYFLCVDTSVNIVTITLPIGILGTVYIIKDCTGDAITNPITIQGTAGQLIDGSITALINAPYGSVQLVFNGTEWSIA